MLSEIAVQSGAAMISRTRVAYNRENVSIASAHRRLVTYAFGVWVMKS